MEPNRNLQKHSVLSISDLPSEIIQNIFSHLSYWQQNSWFSAMSVCKQWLMIGRYTFNPSIYENFPLKCSVQRGKLHGVQWLLRHVDISYVKPSLLLLAIESGNLDLFCELLRDRRINPSADNNASICYACKLGKTLFVKELLQHACVDPAAQNNYPLRVACHNKHLDIVRLLLERGDVNAADQNNYAIRVTSMQEDTTILQELLKRPEVDASSHHNEAVRNASFSGNLLGIKLLMQRSEVDPSDVNNHAIRLAAEYGYLNIVQELIKDNRVDPSAPLETAFNAGQLMILQTLVEHIRQLHAKRQVNSL